MTALSQARNAVKKIPLFKNRTHHASDLSTIRCDLKIPVKSYAIMFSNDRHSPNRDFVFPILFDDTGNWQCIYMGYAWYVFS